MKGDREAGASESAAHVLPWGGRKHFVSKGIKESRDKERKRKYNRIT